MEENRVKRENDKYEIISIFDELNDKYSHKKGYSEVNLVLKNAILKDNKFVNIFFEDVKNFDDMLDVAVNYENVDLLLSRQCYFDALDSYVFRSAVLNSDFDRDKFKGIFKKVIGCSVKQSEIENDERLSNYFLRQGVGYKILYEKSEIAFDLLVEAYNEFKIRKSYIN
jgi:hypothetical protein